MAGRCGVVGLGESEYPSLLRNIQNPPQRLYYRGDIGLLKSRCIAVVGSRRTSNYGNKVAWKLAEVLSKGQVTHVSGMAVGIDSCGHRGMLRAGGRTIAVLGCGLDVDYPAENRQLKEMIAERGLLISEYGADVRGSRFTFPQRNRIISGISEGVVVVEAGEKSGALITASMAGDQGRNVYAVPGNIDGRYSVGCNRLLRDGAMPLVDLDDILLDMGIHLEFDPENLPSLSELEKKVYTIICNVSYIDREEISNTLEVKLPMVNAIITSLEIKGLISLCSDGIRKKI